MNEYERNDDVLFLKCHIADRLYQLGFESYHQRIIIFIINVLCIGLKDVHRALFVGTTFSIFNLLK